MQANLVSLCLPQNLSLANLELLIIGIHHRHLALYNLSKPIVGLPKQNLWPSCPQEGNSASACSQLHSTFHGDSIRGVEDGAAWKGLEHGQVFQSHLAWPILTDGDPTVAAHHVQVGLADNAHSKVVKCSCEEASKGGDEGNCAISASDTDANSNEVLLTDEALNVAVLINLFDALGES